MRTENRILNAAVFGIVTFVLASPPVLAAGSSEPSAANPRTMGGGGSKGGGGGGAFACIDVAGKTITAISQDLYRARERAPIGLGLTPRVFYLADYRSIARTVVERLDEADPAIANAVRTELDAIIEQVESGRALVIGIFPIGDDHRTYPAPECADGRSVFVQAAHFSDDRRDVIVQAAVWWSFRSEADRAALVVHEAIYRVLRVRFGATDSVRAQEWTGRLFSIEPLPAASDPLEGP